MQAAFVLGVDGAAHRLHRLPALVERRVEHNVRAALRQALAYRKFNLQLIKINLKY